MPDLDVRPLHPAIGAEVTGLVPSIPLDDETLRQLRAAFDEHAVLVFRDLDIDEAFQRYLVFMLIGEPEPGPEDAAEKVPMLVSNKVENGAAPYGRLLFHCDNMWARTHQFAISLYGVEVEDPTAPTQFISMGDAWDRVPDDLRARLEGLEARHGFEEGIYPNRGADDDVIDTRYPVSRSSTRPVVYRHPRTGRTLLYISQQATMDIVGLEPEENEALLEELFGYLYDPSRILEHGWRAGDLVIWDNVAAQHGRATVQLQGPTRTLRKVTGPMNLDPDEFLLPVYSKVAGEEDAPAGQG
jgi:alpha-ketoglutarate-dependent taurine dioxygenase